MSESLQMWMEIIFDLSYLLVIWVLVVVMWQQREQVAPAQRPLATLFITAFALLAFGDTGHVGFRVWAYASPDGLETMVSVAQQQIALVGIGSFATAVTVTLFYMLVAVIWQRRFQKSYGWFGWLLLIIGAIRLIMLLLPANRWDSPVPVQPYSTIRNLPLIVQGLGVAFLILRDAAQAHDRTYTLVGIMILASYAFYLPVIFFVQQIPMLGMLMIPKTLAYVAIALIAYQAYYRQPASPSTIMP